MSNQQIFVQVHNVEGCPLAIDKTAKSMYVLTASMKVIVKNDEKKKKVQSKEVFTGPRQKNHVTQGCDFRSFVSGEKGNLLQTTVPVTDSVDDLKVHITIYERLTTDLVQTYKLGDVTTKEIASSEEEAQVQTLVLNDTGGTVRVKVWTLPTPKAAFKNYDFLFTRKSYLFALLWLFVAVRIVTKSFSWAWYVILPGLCIWLAMDFATLLAILLTKILALAVPGLGLSLTAARIGLSLDAYGSLRVSIGVDDFALANDKGFFFKNFVHVKNLKLHLRLDIVDMIRNIYALVFVLKPRPETLKLVRVQGVELAAKDKYLTEKNSSDPYFKLYLAPSGKIPANGEDIHTNHVDPDEFTLLARSKFLKKNLNPEWEEMALDYDNLPDASRDNDDIVVLVYDFDWGSNSDLIGIARVSTLGEFRSENWTERSVTVYKKGEPGGELLFTTSTEETPVTCQFWSPFPTQNELLRVRRRGGPAARIATIGLDVQVNDPTIAFDIAEDTSEFNINNFVRRLAASKLGSAPIIPNVLKLEVLAANGPKKITKVVASLRGEKQTLVAPFESSSPLLFDCQDPSAVIELKAYDKRNRVAGTWITTLKMLLLAPTNVFGKNIKPGAKGKLELEAQLRRKGCSIATDSYLDLKLAWTHEDSGKTHIDILRESNLKALEQLQQNSAETNLKLGDLAILTHMLSDFPILFDVQAFQLNRVNFFLKALFAGYETSNEHDKPIFIDQIDLRDKLKADPGVDLFTLAKNLVLVMVGPVLSEVNLSQAASHILSGVYTGIFSKSTAGAADTGSSLSAPVQASEVEPPSKNTEKSNSFSSMF